jgi:hypothetical protein
MGLELASRADKEIAETPKFCRGGGASRRIKFFNSVSLPFKESFELLLPELDISSLKSILGG